MVYLNEKLLTSLTSDGYTNLQEIEGRGIVGIQRFIYTTAIVYGLNEDSYEGRWCYHTQWDAVAALKEWNGVGDPSGEWIKYKGKGGERSRVAEADK